MGKYINRSDIMSKAQEMRTNIYETKNKAAIVFRSISEFTDTENGLTGKAWDGAREYTSGVQLPVLRMYINCLDLEFEACEKYSQAAESLPGFEKLDEDIIMDAKEKYEKAWDREFCRRHPRQTILDFYEKRITRCQKLLDYIYDFCDETQGIFSETLNMQETLYRLSSKLKLIVIDKNTGEMLITANNADVQRAKEEIGKYYADIQEKEYNQRVKELDEIYDKYGAKAVITNILTQPVEKRLNAKIENEEYFRIAKLLIESRDDYVELLNTTVYYCYDYEKTVENRQGYFYVVNDIYKKSDRLDKIFTELKYVGVYLDFATKNAEDKDKGLSDYRRNWMQLYQVFDELSTFKDKIVTSKRYARQGDSSAMQSKGEYKIKVSSGDDKKIIINFVKYSGDDGGNTVALFEQQRNVTITVTTASRGGTGENSAKDVSADYIYYGFNLDKTVLERIGENIGNYSIVMTTGNFVPWLGNTITTLSAANDMMNMVGETDKRILEESKKINKLGTTVDMFNLYYIASTVRIENGSEICKGRIYQSYKVNTGKAETTKDCIENFNRQFSKGGECEKYAEYIGYDENNPITERNFSERIDEINDMTNRWYDIAVEADYDINDATRRIDE